MADFAADIGQIPYMADFAVGLFMSICAKKVKDPSAGDTAVS